MGYRAVCFDFDYTLGDATESIVAGFQSAFEKMSLPIPDRDAIRATVGYVLEDAYTLLSGDSTQEGKDTFRPLYQSVAFPMQEAGIDLFPGTAELLRGLHQAGVQLAIVSSRRKASIVPTMEREGLLECFSLIIGGGEVTRHKPDPEGLLLVLERLGLRKEELLFCGDTVLDAGAAKSAGVDFAAVLNGTTKAEAFESFPCVTIAEDLWALKKWLERPDENKI